MKINSVFLLPITSKKSNNINQNNQTKQCFLNKNSFDTVSFCASHVTKTETKEIQQQSKVALRFAKKIPLKFAQFNKQGSKLLLKANNEYQNALAYLELAKNNSSFVQLENSNILQVVSISGKFDNSFSIKELNANNQVVREIYFNNSTPYRIDTFDCEGQNCCRFEFDKDTDNNRTIKIYYDITNSKADDIGDESNIIFSAKTGYLYKNGVLHNVLINIEEDEDKITADREYEFDVFLGGINCRLGYSENKGYVGGENGHPIEKTYKKEYLLNSENRLTSTRTNLDDYGIFGLTFDECYLFDKNKATTIERKYSCVSLDDEPVWTHFICAKIGELLTLDKKSDKYFRHQDVLYDCYDGEYVF